MMTRSLQLSTFFCSAGMPFGSSNCECNGNAMSIPDCSLQQTTTTAKMTMRMLCGTSTRVRRYRTTPTSLDVDWPIPNVFRSRTTNDCICNNNTLPAAKCLGSPRRLGMPTGILVLSKILQVGCSFSMASVPLGSLERQQSKTVACLERPVWFHSLLVVCVWKNTVAISVSFGGRRYPVHPRRNWLRY